MTREPDDDYYMPWQGWEAYTMTLKDARGNQWQMKCYRRYNDRAKA